MIILLIVLILIFGIGGPTYLGPRYGNRYGYGFGGFGLILLILLIFLLLR